MTEETKLKPCPFCGGEAKLSQGYDYKGRSLFRIECLNCHSVTLLYDSSPTAIWNDRPIEEALRAENEKWREKSSKAIIEGIEKEDSLRGEIKRLRKALGNIKDKAELVESEASNATYGFAYEIEELTREALKGGVE